MKNSTIKLGILGCGGHAFQSHAVPASIISSYELTAVFDTNKKAYEPFIERFGASIKYCSDLKELLYESGINAIVIATPDEHHVEHLGMAIEANLHILIEKPLASTHKEFNELISWFYEIDRRKLVVTSCHPRRFDPPFLWLKENTQRLVDELGSAIGFDFDFSYHRPSAEWKHDRSLMLDHLNHEIDLLHFLYGRFPFSATRLKDGFDYYEVTGKQFMDTEGWNSRTFRFRGTRRLEERKFLEWAIIRHERGQVTIDTETGEATIFNHGTGETRVEECGATDYPLRFKSVMDNFAKTILGEEENYLTPMDLRLNNWLGIELSETGHIFTNNV